MDDSITNPVDASAGLKAATAESMPEANPQTQIYNEDSSTTKAEKVVRGQAINGNGGDARDIDSEAPPFKRLKLDDRDAPAVNGSKERIKGIAPIKQEYLIDLSSASHQDHDDDAAEASGKRDERGVAGRGARGGKGGKKQSSGQNHSRQFGSSRDAISLCKSRDHQNEFDASECQYGEKCKFEHDIRKYLKDGKREDLTTLSGMCPVWNATGKCPAGWRCRFAGSHSEEVELEDGRKELKLRNEQHSSAATNADGDEEEQSVGVVNMVSIGHRIELRKKKFQTPKADAYLAWLNDTDGSEVKQKRASTDDTTENGDSHGNRARYKEPPLRPSEKRRIYYGPETPILAPLTTQGNMPFRRLCVGLGAQVTWSEMAMSLPLLQGEKGEWALLKAHESETRPPKYTPKSIVTGYDNGKDLTFGAQIAGNKPWLTLKTTEAITELCPSIRAIDLNCGCPIDLVYQQGAGSALLDAPAKLEKILRGMNTVSKDVPITVKIRMGTKDRHATALKLCQRLVLGGPEAQSPAGVAAITLHGRSRQQRYTRTADWEYIAECAALVAKLKTSSADAMDTVREVDGRDLSSSINSNGLPYFIGNGDILTHEDYDRAVTYEGVDSAMIARGALIKPWIFEEIASKQYIDKSATERLAYVEQFARNGLEYWGSDEIGVGITRRFLLEWLSFSCRYVPIGLLEHLPPRIGDRPPAFRGRSELETLLSSGNYKDWIKI
ncbi:tRNA-dihydrouridine synthase 3, partial [Oleoguttula sp. CCFEE 5521]